MLKRLLASAGALLASAGFSVAQYPYPMMPGAGYVPMQPAYVQPVANYGYYNYGYYQPQVMPMTAMQVSQLPYSVGPNVAQPMPTTVAQAVPAQPEVIPPPAGAAPALPAATVPDVAGPGPDLFTESSGGGSAAPRFWASAEYLSWWTKDAPLPVPLVTTSNNLADPTPGALGQPNTSILVGGRDYGFGEFLGGRVTLGFGLSSSLGLEFSGFLLDQRSVQFNLVSNSGGQPYLAVPFFSTTLGAPSAIIVASPFGVGGIAGFPSTAGSVVVRLDSRLWGTEANGVLNLVRNGGLTVDLLGGFRHASLNEGLSLTAHLDARPASPAFATARDRFDTQTQFFGGQLGARMAWQLGRLSLELLGKVALGTSHEVVDIAGLYNIFNTAHFGGFPAGSTVLPVGIFAQRANSGKRSENEFSFLPEVQAKIGFDLTRNLRATLGYTFLYWSKVVRPGDQIDPRLNGGTFLGPPAGATVSYLGNLNGTAAPVNSPPPIPLFNSSTYWAQGISAGLEFRF